MEELAKLLGFTLPCPGGALSGLGFQGTKLLLLAETDLTYSQPLFSGHPKR